MVERVHEPEAHEPEPEAVSAFPAPAFLRHALVQQAPGLPPEREPGGTDAAGLREGTERRPGNRARRVPRVRHAFD